jgi:lysosomal alpha-glucosidase
MNLQMDWSFDNVTFRELPMIVKDLHDHDQHYINIIDVKSKPNISFKLK